MGGDKHVWGFVRTYIKGPPTCLTSLSRAAHANRVAKETYALNSGRLDPVRYLTVDLFIFVPTSLCS